ncbi:hypothetical protein ACFIQF_09275 [Comamonas sp. J-3]|uniref:hypothetical protein n=1 Tax=Comamonas trifloxystrobinivorans TaxID=3350256 RepID=UPI003726D7B4
MLRFFEFADSEISRIDMADGSLHIHFAAAMLRTNAAAASATLSGCSNEQQGYSNGVSLWLGQASFQGDIQHCTGRLSDGKLLHAQQRLASLPLPSQWQSGAELLKLDLQCANGAWLQVQAHSLRCEEAAGARFVEVFKC